MRWFEHVVVAPDGEALRIGERLLEARGKFVHAHESTEVDCGSGREMPVLCGPSAHISSQIGVPIVIQIKLAKRPLLAPSRRYE